jgi:hypothetical protein
MNSTSSRITYFNPLYGTHHKFYGFMDYFYVSSPHNNTGLWDSYITLNYKSRSNMSLQLALHHFEAASKVINYNGAQAKGSLGNEADVTFMYKIMNDVKLSGGYSQMFTNGSMKYVKSISQSQTMKGIQNWVWISLNFNPEILLVKHQQNKTQAVNN